MQAQSGCDSIRTLDLEILQSPVPSLGADKVLCTGDTISLEPGRFDTYRWQDGSANSSFAVRIPGNYAVTVTNLCGSGNDEIIVKEGLCEVRFPSVFSPNNDGINESFKVLGNHQFTEFHLQVYNRWGQKIFDSTNSLQAWNGNWRGKDQPTGVYTWTCTYKDTVNSGLQKLKGTIQLIR